MVISGAASRKTKAQFLLCFSFFVVSKQLLKKQTEQEIFCFQSSILIKYIIEYLELISAFLKIDSAFQQPMLQPSSVGPTQAFCYRNAKFSQLPCSAHCYRSGKVHLWEEESCTSILLARYIN